MLKVVAFLIEVGFWLRAFALPFLLFGVGAGLVGIYDEKLKGLSIFILILGGIAGIVFAEYVRRKYGCSNYFSRLISIPDIEETTDNSEKE
jgi:uncharacterized membrane protein YqaE (UPF0057 family)